MTAAPMPWEEAAQQQMPWDEAKAAGASSDKKQEITPSVLDKAEGYGRRFLSHMGTAAESVYPVRLTKGILGRITNQPGSKEAMSNIATDAIRDFAVAGAAGPESAPEQKPALAIERGPRYMWGKAIPDESGAAPLPEKPPAEVLRARGLATVGEPASDPASSLRRIPVVQPEATDLKPLNVRRPGEIAPEMVRPRAFFGGVRAEPIPAREGLALPGQVAPPEAAPIALPPKTLSRNLSAGLADALGSKPEAASPILRGVPLRDQLKPAETATRLPEGHTPVKSSALTSYKYDPAAKEFSGTTHNGTTYVYGEVTPAQAEAFRSARSKGDAWKAIRDNNVRVATIAPGGERAPYKPGPELRSASPNDMTEDLRDSLREALARRQPKSQPAPPR